MKKTLIATLILLAALAALALAQNANEPAGPTARGCGGAACAWNDKDNDGICDLTGMPVGQGMGRGRGGAPHAWGDKDGDGICDVTGQPVGQGRSGNGPGGGRGMGWCQRGGAQTQAAQPTK